MPDFDLWCVWRGVGQLQVNGCTFKLHPGSAFLFQPGDCIEAEHEADHPLLVYAAHFLPRHQPDEAGWGRLSPDPIHHQLEEVAFWRTQSALSVECWHGPDESKRPLAQAIFWHLLLLILQSEGAPSESDASVRLRQLIAEIRRRPGGAWGVPDMARSCGWSRAQFTRQFRHLTGWAPASFVIRQRITLAEYYLRETLLPISRIAEVLGYRDHFFFSRQFKQQTGEAPRDYRQRWDRDQPSA